ncbi:hypothetical protein FW778_07820 [Ginsengibacter hankyongi]|uniref:Asl1-like glycosyl hydrolase catalytic domain-containing protein n=1 Tax=Ginsengibacter hankyongi TaxID=2607284 RepID=A0A5J5IQN1_9BACT|nr:glycosyl hydrolase [Ginsengibacter hankyongi]KAA9041912.1 hypothetical protein FW778_07820 [Ginsengibacter hankyongi]
MKVNYINLLLFFAMPFSACKKNTTDLKTPESPLIAGIISEKVNFGQMLTISKTVNIGMPKVELYPDTVYTSFNVDDPIFKSLPDGYNDQIVSFRLPKGYMAVFAENTDGTGESACYVATDSAINANLPERLQNNISFIRYMHVNNPGKKGTASTRDQTVQAFNTTQWFYGWSLTRSSLPGQQFVPMTWGKAACSLANVSYLADRPDVDHLLSLNEPDNTNQSNIPNIDTAVRRYKIMQLSGLRLGAPATTQGQAFGDGKWLTKFMSKAQEEKARIDFIPIHWYDWGNQTNNKATDSLTAEGVFKRFQNYVEKVHAAYPDQAIWITEFNANPNRTSVLIHEYFMKLSTDWMNATPFIERYSYFFPNTVPAVNSDFTLTDAGQYWNDLISPKSFSGNIVSAGTQLNAE